MEALKSFVSCMVLDTFRAFRCNSVDEILSSSCLRSLTHSISSFSIAGQSADFPLLAILDFGIFWIWSFCFLQDLTFDSSMIYCKFSTSGTIAVGFSIYDDSQLFLCGKWLSNFTHLRPENLEVKLKWPINPLYISQYRLGYYNLRCIYCKRSCLISLYTFSFFK